MRKRLAILVILFTMVSVFILNYGQPVNHISENDGVIEWHSYSREELV